MVKHKYAVGDRVVAVARTLNQNVRPGVYRIVKALPVTGLVCQYRVKNAHDAHERVLDEDMIRGANG